MSVKTLRRLLPLLLLLALPAYSQKVGFLTATSSLSFGRLVAGSSGTVTVPPVGVRSSIGGVLLLSGGTVTPASFSLNESGTGTSLNWTTITLPSSAMLTGPGATMTLTSFTSNPSGTFAGSGQTILTVGATLTVGSTQAAGNYTGTFSVSVNYE
jgi:hypothetical protein